MIRVGKLSKEHLSRYGLTRKEIELVNNLWGGMAEYRTLSPKKTGPRIESILGKLPGSIVLLDSYGRPVKTKPTYVHLNEGMFEGEKLGFDIDRLGPTSIMSNQGKEFWKCLAKSPATREELIAHLKAKGFPGVRPNTIDTIYSYISSGLKVHLGHPALRSVQLSAHQFIFDIDPRARERFNIELNGFDPFSKLDEQGRKIFDIFGIQRRWRGPDAEMRLGLPRKSLFRKLRFYNRVAVAFGKPEPFLMDTSKKEGWVELDPNYTLPGKPATSDYSVRSYFPDNLLPFIDTIIQYPGVTTDQMAHLFGLPINETQDRIERIKQIIKRNNLPPLITRMKRGHLFSIPFTNRFGASSPINEFLPLLSDNHRAVYQYQVEHPLALHNEIADALNLEISVVNDSMGKIRKYLKNSHFDKFAASKILGIPVSDFRQIKKYLPTVYFDGRDWVSKSIEHLDTKIIEEIKSRSKMQIRNV